MFISSCEGSFQQHIHWCVTQLCTACGCVSISYKNHQDTTIRYQKSSWTWSEYVAHQNTWVYILSNFHWLLGSSPKQVVVTYGFFIATWPVMVHIPELEEAIEMHGAIILLCVRYGSVTLRESYKSSRSQMCQHLTKYSLYMYFFNLTRASYALNWNRHYKFVSHWLSI